MFLQPSRAPAKRRGKLADIRLVNTKSAANEASLKVRCDVDGDSLTFDSRRRARAFIASGDSSDGRRRHAGDAGGTGRPLCAKFIYAAAPPRLFRFERWSPTPGGDVDRLGIPRDLRWVGDHQLSRGFAGRARAKDLSA